MTGSIRRQIADASGSVRIWVECPQCPDPLYEEYIESPPSDPRDISNRLNGIAVDHMSYTSHTPVTTWVDTNPTPTIEADIVAGDSSEQ